MATPEAIQQSHEYVRAVEHDYQRTKSLLWPCVLHDEQEGVRKFRNYIGTIAFAPIVVRNGQTTLQNIDHTRRAVDVHREAAGVPLDADDDLHAVTDLGGPYVAGLGYGAARLIDQTIYAALGGVAYTGETGTTVVNNYDAGECQLMDSTGGLVTAGSQHTDLSETALSVTKLNIINKVFTNNNVPAQNRFALVNQHNVNALIVDTTWGAEEAKVIRDIQEGQMRKLLGWQWIVAPDDLFTTNATDTGAIETYFWQRDAVVFSSGKGKRLPRIMIGPRPDLNYTEQFWADMWVGGTRLRGKGVMEVLLDAA